MKIVKKMKESPLVFIKDASLMLSMFFLPFGYDVIFVTIMNLTESYLITDLIFYLISGLFFTSYILLQKYLNKKNPN